MDYFIRFYRFDDQTRTSSVRLLKDDIHQTEPPGFYYGQLLNQQDISRLAPAEYRVANRPYLRQVEHPAQPGQWALLCEVVLVTPDDWREGEEEGEPGMVWVPLLKTTV